MSGSAAPCPRTSYQSVAPPAVRITWPGAAAAANVGNSESTAASSRDFRLDERVPVMVLPGGYRQYTSSGHVDHAAKSPPGRRHRADRSRAQAKAPPGLPDGAFDI